MAKVYAIDASSAFQSKKTGVEVYAHELINALKNLEFQKDEYVELWVRKKTDIDLIEFPKNWSVREIPFFLPFGWMKCAVSFALFKYKPDLFFVPSKGLPLFSFQTKLVTTIHDLGAFSHSKLYPEHLGKQLRFEITRAIKKSSLIFVPSLFTKNQIELFFSLDQQKIVVAHLASSSKMFAEISQEVKKNVLKKYRISPHFFLYVGRLEKKKNIETIVRAFIEFKKRRGVGDPYELILVGDRGFGFSEIEKWIFENNMKDFVKQLGYIDTEDVASLMNCTNAFLFPSEIEGFGIPILEALRCGTRCLVSNISVFQECFGSNVEYVETKDVSLWVNKLESCSLTEDSDLIKNKRMNFAKQFSWNKTAKVTLDAMRNLI